MDCDRIADGLGLDWMGGLSIVLAIVLACRGYGRVWLCRLVWLYYVYIIIYMNVCHLIIVSFLKVLYQARETTSAVLVLHTVVLHTVFCVLFFSRCSPACSTHTRLYL